MFTKVSKKVSLILRVLLIALLIFLDQITKNLAVNNLKGQSDFIIIKNVLQLHYLENIGAAFSILQGKQLFFLIITPILVLLLIVLSIKMPMDKKYAALNYILIFIIAGALGNYIDRFTYHYVVDFIYFSLINFPVFNVADIYVTCSVILLILLILFYYKDADLEDLKNSLIKKNKDSN